MRQAHLASHNFRLLYMEKNKPINLTQDTHNKDVLILNENFTNLRQKI